MQFTLNQTRSTNLTSTDSWLSRSASLRSLGPSPSEVSTLSWNGSLLGNPYFPHSHDSICECFRWPVHVIVVIQGIVVVRRVAIGLREVREKKSGLLNIRGIQIRMNLHGATLADRYCPRVMHQINLYLNKYNKEYIGRPEVDPFLACLYSKKFRQDM